MITMNTFTFTTILEASQHGKGIYHFAMVPPPIADVLSDAPVPRAGFGSIKCQATIGNTVWSTSVFPTDGLYVLLIAKKIMMAEDLHIGDQVEITLSIREL